MTSQWVGRQHLAVIPSIPQMPERWLLKWCVLQSQFSLGSNGSKVICIRSNSPKRPVYVKSTHYPSQSGPAWVSFYMEWMPNLSRVTFCKCLPLAVTQIPVCKMGPSVSTARTLTHEDYPISSKLENSQLIISHISDTTSESLNARPL